MRKLKMPSELKNINKRLEQDPPMTRVFYTLMFMMTIFGGITTTIVCGCIFIEMIQKEGGLFQIFQKMVGVTFGSVRGFAGTLSMLALFVGFIWVMRYRGRQIGKNAKNDKL